MTIRNDLKWTGAMEFTSLNTREANNIISATEVSQVSNMSFEELGALKKIRGNEISDIITEGGYISYELTGTITSAGTTDIVIPATAINVTLESLVLDAAGGGGGGGAGGSGAPGGCGGGGGQYSISSISLTGQTYQITVGAGGPGGAGGVNSYTNGAGLPGTDGGDTLFKVKSGATLYTATGGIHGNGGQTKYWTDRGVYGGEGGAGGTGTTNGTAGGTRGGIGGTSGAGAIGGLWGNPGSPGTAPGGGGGGAVDGSAAGAAGAAGAVGKAVYTITYLIGV